MKKILLVALAMLMCTAAFAQFKAAPKVNDMKNFKGMTKAEFVGVWSQLSSNYTTQDIDGNAIDLQQDYLNNGITVVIDFSCTWCGPCWNMHNSGMLELLDEMEDIAVLWVEIDEDCGVSEIRGTATGNNTTYGDWTRRNGTPVPYPVIDETGLPTMFRAQYEGYVPTLMVISPDGYYMNLDGYYSYSYPQESAELIALVAQQAPAPGDTPACAIDGPDHGTTGNPISFTALASSADPITGYAWTADGQNAASGQTVSYTWSTPGTYNVYLKVSNMNGDAYDTLQVSVIELSDNILSYTYGDEYASGIGTGSANTVYWGVMFPASMVNGTGLDHVDCYVDAEYPATYTCTVYQDGTTAPGTQVATASKNVTAAMGDAYVTFPLSGNIDPTKNVWVVMSAAQSYPCAGAAYCGNTNSDWISTDGSAWDHAATYNLSYSWMIDCYLTGNAGITTLSNAQVALYPNPATSIVNVKAEGLQQVEVLDVNGRVVMTVKANKVDMSELSNGVYMFRVLTNNGVSMQKVVKK